MKHLKAIHLEKYHQIIQFITDLKEEKNHFQATIQKNNEELQKSSTEVRVHEINLKGVLDKIAKIHAKGEE